MVLSRSLKICLQNIFNFGFHHFGLSSVCYVFQRFYAHLLSAGEVSTLTLLLLASRMFELAKTAEELIQNDIFSAGFIIILEKSDFNLKTKGKWLGTIIDTIEMTFTVPSEKISKLLTDIKKVLIENFLTAKLLAKITRQLSSYVLSNRASGVSFYEEDLSQNQKQNFLVRT